MRKLAPITKNIIIINLIVFLATLVAERNGYAGIVDQLSLHFFLAQDFHFYQLFTYMFLHGGWAHIFFNMFAVWMFGNTIEYVFGSKRYLIFYLVCGVGAGITQEVWQLAQFYIEGLNNYTTVAYGGLQLPMSEFLNSWSTIGASGACYGILLAFGMTFPNERIILLIPPIPIKAKYFVAGYAVLEMFQAFTGSNAGIAHFAHLGGMLFGWLLILYWRNNNNRGNPYNTWSGTKKRSQNYRFFFDKIANIFKRSAKTKPGKQSFKGRESDYEFNARRKAERDEIDKILGKIKRSGYDSLTDEEKKKLFENSKRG